MLYAPRTRSILALPPPLDMRSQVSIILRSRVSARAAVLIPALVEDFYKWYTLMPCGGGLSATVLHAPRTHQTFALWAYLTLPPAPGHALSTVKK